MNDPYKTLGVEPSASDEEVKRAYRDLARKYHPDRFPDDSAKELAEEKMKEINEAYDQIQKMRQGGASGGYGGGSTGGYGGSYGGSGVGVYGRIRQYIQMGNLVQAEQMLNSVPDKNAEWYFLYGALCQRKGWFDEAQRNFQTACNMDPSNAEYRQALTMMQNGGGMYRGGSMGSGGLSGCGCCGDLLCADCCCECMGGDLIPCC